MGVFIVYIFKEETCVCVCGPSSSGGVYILGLLFLLLQLCLQLHLPLLAFLLPPHPLLQQRCPLLGHVLLWFPVLLRHRENKAVG